MAQQAPSTSGTRDARLWGKTAANEYVPIELTPDGKLPVDATVTIGDITIDNANGAIEDGADPSIKATVRDYANGKPLAVEAVDENGDPRTVWPVQTEQQRDLDTSGSTEEVSLVAIGLPGSGGAVVGGTATNPLRTDPTGVTTQPVVQAGAAHIANGQVTVDTTSGGVQIVGTRSTRRCVTIVNLGTTDVWVGAGTVTASNGQLLLGVKGASVSLDTTAAVKAIVASGSQDVSFLEEYD